MHHLDTKWKAMERWRGRTALVTGASSGIGAAVACRLVHYGLKVIGCGRNVKKILAFSNQLKEEEGMSFVHGGSLFPLKCDISKEDNIIKMFQIIKELYGGVDICIHCACVKPEVSFLQGSNADIKRMFEINVQACSIINREVVKSLTSRELDDGHIFYINSTIGHLVPEDESSHVLSVTHHACLAQVEALRLELRKIRSRVRTTTISPGKTKKEYTRRSGGSYEQNGEIMLDVNKALEPDDVAAALIYALGAPSHVQVDEIVLRPVDEVREGTRKPEKSVLDEAKESGKSVC